jgi:hypothetical protein
VQKLGAEIPAYSQHEAEFSAGAFVRVLG